MIEVVTVRDTIRKVAKSWRDQYGDREVLAYGNAHEIHKKLAALDVETATEADVTAIIGNDTWTRLHCDSCGYDYAKPAIVIVGEKLDYESSTARLCIDCVTKAYEMLKAALVDEWRSNEP